MKIAIIGYGRMGKTIETLALDAGHEIVLKTSDLASEKSKLRTAEVAIEFTQPDVAVSNIITCLEAGVPVVSGTTGWLQKGKDGADVFGPIGTAVKQYNGAFFYSSNFSLGVNVFFKLNQQLAKMMRNINGYNAEITEAHHIHKLDAPSGTAITLAQDLINESDRYKDWLLTAEYWPTPNKKMTNHIKGVKANKNQLSLTSIREGETPGTHQIRYKSEVDAITIEHKAYGRIGFAKGALAAAEWLPGKQGILGMDDLLGL